MQPGSQNDSTRRAPTPSLPKPRGYSFLKPGVESDEIGRLGNYRVLRPLGEGGMAFLFVAEDLSLRRPVALKVMKPDLEASAEAWQRFLREARLTASVRHEHLVTVFNAGQDGDACFFAMELLEGESLDARMKRAPGLRAAAIARIGREIASGLAVIHSAGLIHRDIKPSNIWLEAPDGRVKVLDLGLARPVQNEIHLTQSGLVVGTPAFMSPEQARGEPLDLRTDLFSLGCVLYNLCTGLHPFEGATTMAVLTALAVDNPRPPAEQNPAIPLELSQLIMRLLAKEPAKRPSAAEEIIEELRAIEAAHAGDPELPAFSHVAEDEDTDGAPRRKAGSGTQALSKRNKRSKRRKKQALNLKIWVPVIVFTILLTAALTFGAVAFLARPRHPGPPPGPDNGTPLAPNAAYVMDLPILDNHAFGPMGDRPPPHEQDLLDRKASYHGRRLPKGIFMHPGPDGLAAEMVFNLDKRFGTFQTDVTLNDDVRETPPPLTFLVYGDDKLLWTSPNPVRSQANKQACRISVKGVSRLKLQVKCTGEPRGGHALWIDPRVEP